MPRAVTRGEITQRAQMCRDGMSHGGGSMGEDEEVANGAFGRLHAWKADLFGRIHHPPDGSAISPSPPLPTPR